MNKKQELSELLADGIISLKKYKRDLERMVQEERDKQRQAKFFFRNLDLHTA